jgi:hypothetical protein
MKEFMTGMSDDKIVTDDSFMMEKTTGMEWLSFFSVA